MDLRVLSQPYRESQFTGQTFLSTALGDPGVDQLIVITAWVRRSGMRLLVPGLEELRRRGGRAQMFFGVDLRGTSRQGVELARQHFDDLYVVHDPSGGTFHPKIYLARGAEVGYALIGSNNLSAGGLWHNHEAAMVAIFDPRRETEVPDGVDGFAAQLMADAAICKRVSEPIFHRLLAEGWLTDETRDRRQNEDRPSETTSPRRPPGEPLFTASQAEKRGRPAPAGGPVEQRNMSNRTRRTVATAPDNWWKPLGAGDAQHPVVGHPTGNVALTHVPRNQDRDRYFRDIFFAGARWRDASQNNRLGEEATITAQVEIESEDLGEHEFTAVYRPHRSERGRATTVLRWGTLLPELRERDLSDWYLIIERADIGRYRLRFTRTEPA